MIPISIDISPILDTYAAIADRSEEFSSIVLDAMVDTYMFEWQNMVNSELHQTRNKYNNCMDVEQVDSHTAIMKLLPDESGLPLMIEDGASQFDEKEGFKKSSKIHEKEDGGWYLTIPLRHATSQAIGESMVFASKMPMVVQKVAEKVAPAAVAAQDLPQEYQRLGINKTSGYIHKNPIYEGLHKRKISSTQKENRSGYFTFRRVSDQSEDGSWQHPGFEAKKFMDRAAQSLESSMGKVLNDVTDEYLDKLFG